MRFSARFLALSLIFTTVVGTSLTLHAQPAASPAVAEKQVAVVHLSHYTDDLHRAFMALKVATLMQKRGVDCSLFLDIEGARISDKRQSLDVRWGSSEMTLAQLYDGFIGSGGQVVVCPHCAKAAGVTQSDVRPGATIATEDDLATMFVDADKVVDY